MKGLDLETRLLALTSSVLLISLFINLGTQPLYLEEPRRGFIAMEMLENGNFLVPTMLGEEYYKKPPFFNLILLISAFLFGGFSEFALRLPTVLSTIGIGLLMFWIGRRYVDFKFGWLSGLLFVSSSTFLFYFSTLAEIDLFYSFITFLGIIIIFHFHYKQQYYSLFLLTYLLAAVGTLTKGLPSILFTGISLSAFFLYQRDFKRLFSLPNFLGLFLYVLIVGGYLFWYDQYANLEALLAVTWGQSSERTVIQQGIAPLVSHILFFPFDIAKDIVPGVFLVFFAIRKDLWSVLKSNQLITFSTIMLLANIAIYWVSPGTRLRYIYMLYPFLLMILLYAYTHRKELNLWRQKVLNVLCGFIMALLPFGALAINFIPDFYFLSYLWPLSLVSFTLFGFLFYFFTRYRQYQIIWLILAISLGRIVFDLTILPQRDNDSGGQRDRDLGYQIAEISQDAPIYQLTDTHISFTTVFYLDQAHPRVLTINEQPEPGPYYIAEESYLLKNVRLPYKTHLRFGPESAPFLLVQFEEN